MQTKERRPLPGVTARLQATPYRFQFMQAVRVLLISLRRAGVPPERALRDILRFQNSLSLSFPASEIEALLTEPVSEAPGDGLPDTLNLAHVWITPAFIGLLGGNGTLPLHYTERIAAYEHATHDRAARAYLDMFSHRIVSLFFKAWGKYRVEHSLDVHGKDEFRPLLLALAGKQANAWRTDGVRQVGLDGDVAAFYAGLLRQRPMSATALRCILPDYFGVPITIEQFTGAWDTIADDRQCKMGGSNATLGYSGALGVRRWRHDLRVTLRIGPLSKNDFERFLPGAPGAQALKAMLAMVGVAGLQYLAHVILKPEEVEPLELAGGAQQGVRLGWDARIGTAAPNQPTDVRYLLRPA
jgi:type VI secretion system protein ImpH